MTGAEWAELITFARNLFFGTAAACIAGYGVGWGLAWLTEWRRDARR